MIVSTQRVTIEGIVVVRSLRTDGCGVVNVLYFGKVSCLPTRNQTACNEKLSLVFGLMVVFIHLLAKFTANQECTRDCRSTQQSAPPKGSQTTHQTRQAKSRIEFRNASTGGFRRAKLACHS